MSRVLRSPIIPDEKQPTQAMFMSIPHLPGHSSQQAPPPPSQPPFPQPIFSTPLMMLKDDDDADQQ